MVKQNTFKAAKQHEHDSIELSTVMDQKFSTFMSPVPNYPRLNTSFTRYENGTELQERCA